MRFAILKLGIISATIIIAATAQSFFEPYKSHKNLRPTEGSISLTSESSKQEFIMSKAKEAAENYKTIKSVFDDVTHGIVGFK